MSDWIERMTPELWAKRAAMREEVAAKLRRKNLTYPDFDRVVDAALDGTCAAMIDTWLQQAEQQ